MKKLTVNLQTTDDKTILLVNGDQKILPKKRGLHFQINLSIPPKIKGEKSRQAVLLEFFISNFLTKKYELKYRLNNHEVEADEYIKNIVFEVDEEKDNYSLTCDIADEYFIFAKPSF